jgi:hypothetical protein
LTELHPARHRQPHRHVPSDDDRFGHELFFDVGGVVAAAALVLTLIVSAVANTRALYRAEPLPMRRIAG